MSGEAAHTSLEVEKDLAAAKNPCITYVVYGFVVWCYLCVLWVVFVPWWSTYADDLASFLTFFFITMTGSLTLYCYYKAINTSPGSPPPEWKPAHATPEELNEAIKASGLTRNKSMPPPPTKTKGIRYCSKCVNFKPPRAHHCSECQRCILKMDHHCPWIDNCVGHFNHKYFILFLFYALVSMIFALFLFGSAIVSWASPEKNKASSISVVRLLMLITSVMFMIPATFGMIGLFIYQIILLRENTTNIETYEKELASKDAQVDGKPFKWTYDRGGLDNMKEVLGQSVWVWFIPAPVSGDGIRWRSSTLTPQLLEA